MYTSGLPFCFTILALFVGVHVQSTFEGCQCYIKIDWHEMHVYFVTNFGFGAAKILWRIMQPRFLTDMIFVQGCCMWDFNDCLMF